MKQYDLLLNEDRIPYLYEKESFDYDGTGASPQEVFNILTEYFKMDKLPEEHMILICLNSKLIPVGVFDVSHGTINTSLIHPRELFKRAFLCNAASIIISHNHPSGDPYPSNEDRSITARIKEAGELLGISMIDHIIIGDDDYISFQELGLL